MNLKFSGGHAVHKNGKNQITLVPKTNVKN